MRLKENSFKSTISQIQEFNLSRTFDRDTPKGKVQYSFISFIATPNFASYGARYYFLLKLVNKGINRDRTVLKAKTHDFFCEN